MKIKEKLFMNREEYEKEGPITIVAFGDSVTHGALLDSINYETVYWNLLKKKLNAVRDYVPVNVINAGVGGTCAKASVARMEKQVLNHLPDLVIVCFGLNDVNGEKEEYLSALEAIFEKCNANKIDTIFMTPNMLNTYVADDTPEEHREYALKTAEFQNSGRMDDFICSAKKLAEDMGVTVCDCYSKWKKLSETEDTTKLLINRINHPAPEMHELFAEELFKVIFADGVEKGTEQSTMFEK